MTIEKQRFLELNQIEHFTPDELFFLGNQHYNENSRGFGLNHLPPFDLWRNILPTISVVERLRSELNAPIRIISGYRNKEYNRAIGGAPYSQHLRFCALDIVVLNELRPIEYANILKKYRKEGMFKGGIGVYPTFVHIDTRGTNADW